MCVSSDEFPNLVDPEENDSVKYATEDETIYCCAVRLPVITKSPDTVPPVSGR
jgi:hypothetical protein